MNLFNIMIKDKLFVAIWLVLSWIVMGSLFVYEYTKMIILSVLNAFQSIYRR
jgi:hypothetical protein